MDFSLRDAFTGGAPKTTQESLLKRDFMAELEAQTFDDKVGETVGKTEYRPLVDGMEGKREGRFKGDSSPQHDFAVSSLSASLLFGFLSGGQTGGLRQDPQGEIRPSSPGQYAYKNDFQSGPTSMIGMPAQTGHQQMGSTMKDNSRDSYMGFSQPVGMNINVGMAPFQNSKSPDLQKKTSPLFAHEPPKPSQITSSPSETSPRNSQDYSPEVWGNPRTGVEMLSTEQSHALNKTEQSFTDLLGSHSQDAPSGEEQSIEEETEKQQKRKKKKRRNREEMYDFLDSLGSPDSEETPSESSNHGCPSPPSEIQERGGGCIKAKKSKSRMKLPEEWGAPTGNSSISGISHPNTSNMMDIDYSSSNVGDSKTQSQVSIGQGSLSPSFTPNSLHLTDTQACKTQPTGQGSTSLFTSYPGTTTTHVDDEDKTSNDNLGGKTKLALPGIHPSNQLPIDSKNDHTHPTDPNQSTFTLSPTHTVMLLDSVLQEQTPDASPPSQSTPVKTPLPQIPAIESGPNPTHGPLTIGTDSPVSQSTLATSHSFPTVPPEALPFVPSLTEKQEPPLAQPPLLEGWTIVTRNVRMSSQRSECRDLCSMPPSMPGLASSSTSQGWTWQQGKADNLASSRLLEDKQGFPTRSTTLNQEPDQWVTSQQNNRSGTNLGSMAESPTSLSSSPSPVSPGRPLSTNGVTPGSTGSLSGQICSDLHKPDNDWNPPPSISGISNKTYQTQNPTPNYCVISVVNDSYAEGTFEGKTETHPPPGTFPMQQNRVVQRTMSDSTHLTVPASVQLPDKYPGKDVPPLQAAVKCFTVDDKQSILPSTNISSAKKDLPAGAPQTPDRDQLQPLESLKAVSTPAFSDVQPKGNCNVKEDKTGKEKMEKVDNINITEKQDKPEKMEKIDHLEKSNESTKKTDNVDKTQKNEQIIKDEKTAQKEEKQDNKVEKHEKIDKPEKTNKEKEEKKEHGEKLDKTAKAEKNVTASKGPAKSPTANGSKPVTSPDSKAKPSVGSTKQSSTRPNSLSTGHSAATKRISPTTNSANKKSPVPKATTPTTGSKKSPTSKSAESGTATQRRPPVPKAKAASATNSKTGTSTPATTKSARHSSATKPENHAGEVKKTTPVKTTPKSARTPTSANATSTDGTNGTPRPSRITKPPVPKQTPLERKPPVPRAPRNVRPTNAPMPDLKHVRSKIGSTDNIKYQPGGGKVSAAQGKADALPKTNQGKVQIVHKKLDFSHVTSRCGSKDNIKHVPGGGNVQILNKKVDLSKVTAKCGSKDNMKHKPVGGDVKNESQNMNGKAKVGSLDNVGHEPGGGNVKAEGVQQKSEGSPSSPAISPPSQMGSGAKENGLKEISPTPVLSLGEGPRDSQGLDKRIPGTN
nr:mucin-2 [Misgurnus anguillicaudatus]